MGEPLFDGAGMIKAMNDEMHDETFLVSGVGSMDVAQAGGDPHRPTAVSSSC
jgi:hypothetical protein